MSEVRAVIFDWGGTLTPWHTVDPREAWAAAVDDADLAARLAAAETEVWQRSIREGRSATLVDVFTAAGADHDETQLAAFGTWWEPHTFTDPDVAPLFEALRARGLRIGVLSNTLWTRVEHERIFARDGVLDLIDGAVYTSEIAHTKPHPEAFRAALAAVGVADPALAVFVGDRLFDDIHGASAVGMRTILVPHSDIPASQRGHVEGKPDAVVERLTDVLAVVDAWREQSGASSTDGRRVQW